MTQRTDDQAQRPPDRDELWRIYLKQNPHWETDGAHLTADGLKKFVAQVWQHGYHHATDTTKVTIE